MAESSCLPVAPDFLLIPMALKLPGQGLWLATITTFGSALGGLLGYAIGYHGGRPLLRRFASAAKVTKVEALFERHGPWGVAVAGFTPISYKIFTIASGVCRLHIVPFVIASVVSRGLRFFLIVLLLERYGEHVRQNLDIAGALLLAAIVIRIGVWWLRRGRRAEPGSSEAPVEGGVEG